MTEVPSGLGVLQRIQEVLRGHQIERCSMSSRDESHQWGRCKGCDFESVSSPLKGVDWEQLRADIQAEHVAALVLAFFTEVVETIPVFVLNDPPEFCTKMVGPPRPKKHIEFIKHTHYATPRHSIDCPDCASDPGIHESRQAAIRAEVTK